MYHFFGAYCDNFSERELMYIQGASRALMSVGADENTNLHIIRKEPKNEKGISYFHSLAYKSELNPLEFYRSIRNTKKTELFTKERGKILSFNFIASDKEDEEDNHAVDDAGPIDSKRVYSLLSGVVRSSDLDNIKFNGLYNEDDILNAFARVDGARDEASAFGYEKDKFSYSFITNHRKSLYFAKISGSIMAWGTSWEGLRTMVRSMFPSTSIHEATKIGGNEHLTINLAKDEYHIKNVFQDMQKKR